MANNNNNDFLWKQDRWNGGLAEDSRIGTRRGALRYMMGADVRSDSGKVGVLFKPTRHDGSAVDKLVKWIEVNPANSDVYYYGEDEIFKETGGTTTSVRTVAAGTPNGQGLCHFDGYLYYRTTTTLGRYDYASTWNDSWQTGLASDSDFAMMCRYKNFLIVPNGRYIGVVDDVGAWDADRLTLPPDYRTRSVFKAGPYLVILAYRGTNIFDGEEGYMFLWDGASEGYIDAIPLDGNPHAGIGSGNRIILVIGQEPILQYSYGAAAEFLYSVPNVGVGKTAEVFPGAIDLWRGLIYFAISDGTSTSVTRSLYAWGKTKSGNEEILTTEYPISTGATSGTAVQITAVKRVGKTVRYAWKHNSTYGVDYIDLTSYQSEAIVRTLALDRDSPFEKEFDRLMVELVGKLKADETVTAKISSEPYEDPTFADTDTLVSKTESTDDKKLLELPLINAANLKTRDYHMEVRYGGSGATRPSVKRMWLAFSENADQL